MGDTQLLGGLAQGPVIAVHWQAVRPQQGDKFGAIAVAAIGQLGTAFSQQFAFVAGASTATEAKADHQQPGGRPQGKEARAKIVPNRPETLD